MTKKVYSIEVISKVWLGVAYLVLAAIVLIGVLLLPGGIDMRALRHPEFQITLVVGGLFTGIAFLNHYYLNELCREASDHALFSARVYSAIALLFVPVGSILGLVTLLFLYGESIVNTRIK